jgi:hypothetical protein
VSESRGFFGIASRAAGWVVGTALTVGDNLWNAGAAVLRRDAEGRWDPDWGTAGREALSAALIGGGTLLLAGGLILAAPYIAAAATTATVAIGIAAAAPYVAGAAVFALGTAGFLSLPSLVRGITGYQSQDGPIGSAINTYILGPVERGINAVLDTVLGAPEANAGPVSSLDRAPNSTAPYSSIASASLQDVPAAGGAAEVTPVVQAGGSRSGPLPTQSHTPGPAA